MADPDRDVSTDELARWLGISPAAVSKCVARGWIERSYRGRFPLQESIQRYCQQLRQLERSGGEDTAAARAKLLAEQASLARIKKQRLEGSLVDCEAVKSEWCAILTNIRARLLAIPARLQQTVPHLTRADIEALDREIRMALEALAADGATHEVENPPS